MITDVKKIGRRGETKDVADGYAHNFLIPQKKAFRADTAEAKKFLESLKSQSDKVTADEKAIIKILSGEPVALTIVAKGNEKGHLYKAVGAKEIAAAFAQLYQNLPSIDSYVKDCAFKETGDHLCMVKIGSTQYSLTVTVKGE